MGLAVQIILAIISLVGAVVVAWLTARSSERTKRTEVTAAPYDKLADRVSQLETQVGLLIHERDIDRAYIRRLLPAWRVLPTPMPAWLARERGPHYPETPGSIIEPPNR